MNAAEARELATKVVTNEQKYMAESAMGKIQHAAQEGQQTAMLFPRRPDWLKTYLEGEGYQVEKRVSGDQRDGPMLVVSW